jgi:succinate dehydrogenase / fumarate reductase cytochrome b subunit
MSTSALVAPAVRPLTFWSTTNGKKAVMAVSGIVLTGFLVGHLAGNLQIFAGPEKINAYGRLLREAPLLTWTVRIVVLVSAILHIWSSIELGVRKVKARPTRYYFRRPIASTYASRTMYWSGPILAAFVVYHLMQFTFGTGGTPFREGDIYNNMVSGFRVPFISAFYVVAMFLLCTHLRHGLWSLFQTLGFTHPRYTPWIKAGAIVVAYALFLGFASIPLAVMSGAIRPEPTLLAPAHHH